MIDGATGPTACREFIDRNTREGKEWANLQPQKRDPYKPREMTMNAPWPIFLGWLGDNPDLVAATLLPHPGIQLRGKTPTFVLSWPWSFPIGPAFSCTRKGFDVNEHKAHRFVLEPEFVLGERRPGFAVRPGYRFIYQPVDWVVGVGGGVGSTLDVAIPKQDFRASVSPEALIRFGHCCEPSYFLLALRTDIFFAGDSPMIGASLGYTYF